MDTLGSIRHLLDDVARLREGCLHDQEEEAPNFNLFRILDVEEKEVSTHSSFLAHLLTPGETHAQGDLFLKRFLSEIKHEELKSSDGWTVSRELVFSGGRLDIVLQSANARAIIVVENKVGAEDHTNQLAAYRKWLDSPRRRRAFSTRLLLYLTPTGANAKNSGQNIDYKTISYSEDIVHWLHSCLPEVKATRVKSSIEAYLRTIKQLNTQTLMQDDLDERILNLLKDPEKRSSALRIARVGNSLKEEMLQEFWVKGRVFLMKKLADKRFAYWSLKQEEGAALQSYYGITLVGKSVNAKKPHPQFVFFQYNTARLFRWEIVVSYDGRVGGIEKIRRLPEAKELTDEMACKFDMPKKYTWDGYSQVTPRDDSEGIERTLEKECLDGHYFGAFFDEGWKKFQGLEPYLRRLTDAVQKAKPRSLSSR